MLITELLRLSFCRPFRCLSWLDFQRFLTVRLLNDNPLMSVILAVNSDLSHFKVVCIFEK